MTGARGSTALQGAASQPEDAAQQQQQQQRQRRDTEAPQMRARIGRAARGAARARHGRGGGAGRRGTYRRGAGAGRQEKRASTTPNAGWAGGSGATVRGRLLPTHRLSTSRHTALV